MCPPGHLDDMLTPSSSRPPNARGPAFHADLLCILLDWHNNSLIQVTPCMSPILTLLIGFPVICVGITDKGQAPGRTSGAVWTFGIPSARMLKYVVRSLLYSYSTTYGGTLVGLLGCGGCLRIGHTVCAVCTADCFPLPFCKCSILGC